MAPAQSPWRRIVPPSPGRTASAPAPGAGARRGVDPRTKLCCLVCFMLAVFWVRSPFALGMLLALSCALALAARVRARALFGALRGFAVILVFTVFMQVCTIQQGTPLFVLGSVSITDSALFEAAAMLARLLALLLSSLAFARSTASSEFVRAFDWALAPARALGLRTGALSFSLSVAFRFAPVLVSDFSQLRLAQRARLASFDGSLHERLQAYLRLFPPLVRSAFRRADTLAEAGVSRCLARKGAPTNLHLHRFGWRDALAAALAAAILAFALFA